jgi:transcriptional regulator GlxA family with amidase domain
MVDTLLTAVVLTFPNTTMTRGYLPGPGDVQPSAVRRAAAFIGANASLPINLTDIARSAGTTPRAIRVAFRRHLDTTPSEYLRRERLAAAHHDLQAADPTRGTTVAQIALRWGFPDPSRFTNAYRAAYGTPPGHTLGK